MPNIIVKKKMLDHSSNAKESAGWLQLAEDAEKDAKKARLRSEQLSEAARIFRRNAESGFAFPSATHN